MSEHELWNELGNLYYLSGSLDQAVQAYNKAIQSDSEFGKPYSNLALIYAKQARYEDAVLLYRRSLDLLNTDEEKAIAWDRLGNVYRQKMQYQEAVFAFQCADEIRFTLDERDEQSNSMLYVSSESLPYEHVDEQQDYQNHSADYMHDIEPEFNDELPEVMPVEAELPVHEIHIDRNSLSDWKIEEIADAKPAPLLQPEEAATNPVSGQVERETSAQVQDAAEETPHSELEVVLVDEPETTTDFEEIPVVIRDIEGPVSLDTSPADDAAESSSVVLDATAAEADTSLDEDAPASYPVAGVPVIEEEPEDEVEALPEELTLALSEAADRLDSDAQVHGQEVEDSAAQVKDDLDEASGDEESLQHEEPESEFMPEEPIAQAQDEDNVHDSDPASLDITEEEALPAASEDAQKAKREIDAEAEKLAQQIEINPRSATTWEALGTLYKTAGRYDEAVQAFNQAIAIAPGEVSYYHNLGLVYAAQGNNEAAFSTFQKVLELDPGHSLAHASLGGYYKKNGLDELAKKHIEKAMEYIYESENEYNRACLDAICGNTDQAIDLLRVALKNKQTYVDWVLHDPDLDSLRKDQRFKQLIAEFSK